MSFLAFVSSRERSGGYHIPFWVVYQCNLSGADQEQAAAMIDELLQFVDNRSGISEAGHLSA